LSREERGRKKREEIATRTHRLRKLYFTTPQPDTRFFKQKRGSRLAYDFAMEEGEGKRRGIASYFDYLASKKRGGPKVDHFN